MNIFLTKRKKLIAKPGLVYADNCFQSDADEPSLKILIVVSYLHGNCIFVNLTTSKEKTTRFTTTLEIESTDKCFIDETVTFEQKTFVQIGKNRIRSTNYYELEKLDNNNNLKIIGHLKCEYLLKILNLILANKTIIGKYKKIVEHDIKKHCS